jgi:hypothetical protein
VLILKQARCTVCSKCTIGSEIVLDAPGGTPRCHGCSFGPFGDVVSVVQDRWRVNVKYTIGSKIILDAPDGTPRLRGLTGSSFQSVWR